jgi:hypothetical protein
MVQNFSLAQLDVISYTTSGSGDEATQFTLKCVDHICGIYLT